MRLAGNAGCKNSPSGHHHTTKARIDNRKKLVKLQYLPPHVPTMRFTSAY